MHALESWKKLTPDRPVEFALSAFLADPDGYNATLLEVLR